MMIITEAILTIEYFNVMAMDANSKSFFPEVIYKYVPILFTDEKYSLIYELIATGQI
jgi:hypothetical protein